MHLVFYYRTKQTGAANSCLAFSVAKFHLDQCNAKKTKIRLLGHTGSDLQETLLAGNNSVINENKAITNREKTHNIVQTNRINSLDLALLQEPFKRLNTRMSAIKCKSQRCGVVCSFLDSFDSGNAI